MAVPVVNFGLVTVSTGYAAGATSVALQTGEGSKLPDITGGLTFPMTWWDSTDYPHPADDPNVEIVLVTGISGDTLTVTRAQEGTSATNKNTPDKTYRMSLGITKAMWDSLQRPTSFVQGLQLQTHRDSDLAAYQVELVDVDSIIMDDGTELRNDNDEWTGKTADITVSGAGGLDTGTEQNAWYEIYAIAKEDGTRNLLLHTSKLWAVDANYQSGDDATQAIRSAVDNSNNKVAQGFQLSSSSGKCVYIEVKLIRVGTPTGKIWFTIQNDNAGVPGTTVLATSQAYDVARLPSTAMTIRIPMKTSAALSTSTQYHLVAQGSWTVSVSNYVGWRYDGSSPAYTNGAMAIYDSDGGGVWSSNSGRDAMFAIALETNDSAVILPSGYTKKCFLGWVYNNGTGNFNPFIQVGRSVRAAAVSSDYRAWSASGAAELIDILQFIPPLPLCRAYVAIGGTGSGGALFAIGDLRATDISSSGDSTGAQIILSTSITSAAPSAFGSITVQHLGIMAVGTFGAYIWIVGFDF